MEHIKSYKELGVYQAAVEAAMRIFEVTKRFPAEEKFSMVDQMRRSSRSVVLEHRGMQLVMEFWDNWYE